MTLAFRQFLKDDLAEIRARRKNYSLRAYARDLGVNPTSLSLFLNGKRGLSEDVVKQLAEKFQLQVSTEIDPARSRFDADHGFKELDLDNFRMIADWYYFAILSLAETSTFQSDSAWIAARLGLTSEVIDQAIPRLERLGMLLRDAAGNLQPSGKQYTTPKNTPDSYRRRGHIQSFELARISMEKDPVDRRDISSMTMAVNPDHLPQAFVEIAKFRRKMMKLLESGDKREVYRMGIQLFPHTQEV